MIITDVTKRCYLDTDRFITDLLENKLPEKFKLSHSVVQEVIDMIMRDREIACRINAMGVPTLMMVEDTKDMRDILTLAEVIANG